MSGNRCAREPVGRVVGGSTDGGNPGNRGPALLPPPPPPHPLLHGHKPLQQGCAADCGAARRREEGVGLRCWEYLDSF